MSDPIEIDDLNDQINHISKRMSNLEKDINRCTTLHNDISALRSEITRLSISDAEMQIFKGFMLKKGSYGQGLTAEWVQELRRELRRQLRRQQLRRQQQQQQEQEEPEPEQEEPEPELEPEENSKNLQHEAAARRATASKRKKSSGKKRRRRGSRTRRRAR